MKTEVLRKKPLRVPAGASQRLSDYITTSLANRWRTYRLALSRCRAVFSEKSVHDLRVAIRRMVSTLDMAEAVVDDRGLRVVRRDLKRRLQAFSELRDVQVHLLLVGEMLARHPQTAVLRTMLLVKEERLKRRLRGEVGKAGRASHAAAVENLRRSVNHLFCDPSRARSRRAAVIATATAAFARAVQRKEMADRSSPASIHRLRVAFKKFRYKAEMLQPLLPWLSKERLVAMNAYQTRMGEVQDIEGLIALVRDYTARTRRRPGPSFHPVVLELLARRRELVRRFFAGASELYTFWPVAVNEPDAIFTRTRRSTSGTTTPPTNPTIH